MSSSKDPGSPNHDGIPAGYGHSLITQQDLANIPAADLVHLVAWARYRRRLWLLAVPGLGLVIL